MSLPTVLQGNLSLPVICSPLFIISNPDLVIAQCKAGVVGSFPALNARPAEVLDEWLQRITSELADYKAANPDAVVAPFAVNQIVHGSNDRLQHDVELCVKYKVPIIITSLRAPNEVVGPIHSYGGLVFHDVINVKHAKKAIEAGVDGLILEDHLDHRELATQMRRLIEDEELLKTCSNQAKRKAEMFTWDRTADATIFAYQNVLSILRT